MKQTQTQPKKPASDKEDVQVKAREQTASQRATEDAKKGPPLNAERPQDRSPKQENL